MKPALYTAFISGAGGSNIILFYLSESLMTGIDTGGGKYRGAGTRLPSGALRGNVILTVPAGQPIVTGMPPLTQSTDIPISFELPPGFDDGRTIVPIATPLGPINARFEKFTELP